MKTKLFLFFLAVWGIALTSSCSTAIIDEGDIEDLTPIQETVLYNPDVQNLMFNYCVTCHGGAAPSGGVDLTNYGDVRFYTEDGKLNDRINDAANPMPPSGLLSIQERQMIAKWIEDGFPNN